MQVYDIQKYGASADKKINTIALQLAIDDCYLSGGGTVLVHGGAYQIGTIQLKSNVTIQILAGSSLLGSTDIEDYPDISSKGDGEYFGQWTGIYDYPVKALIFAENAFNIKICGDGSIDGQYERNKVFLEATMRNGRPYGIYLKDCKNVVLEGLELYRTAHFMTRLINCVHLKCLNLNLYSLHVPCGDGIDLFGGRNINIANCNFETGDDCICFKSYHEETTENVAITNCNFTTVCAAIRFGPESSGLVRGVTIDNCTFDCCSDGIKIQSSEGNVISNINVSNCVMRNVDKPICITVNSYAFNPKNLRPQGSCLKNVMFSNLLIDYDNEPKFNSIVPYTLQGIFISGTSGHCLENINFNNINMTFKGGIRDPVNDSQVYEFIDSTQDYVELYKLGVKALPASAIFLRRAKDCRLTNIKIRFRNDDCRAPIVIHHCADTFFGLVDVGDRKQFIKEYDCVNTHIMPYGAQSLLDLSELETKQYFQYQRLSESVNLIYNNEAALFKEVITNTTISEELRCKVYPSENGLRYKTYYAGATHQFLVIPWCFGDIDIKINQEDVYSRKIPDGYRVVEYLAVALPDTSGKNLIEIKFSNKALNGCIGLLSDYDKIVRLPQIRNYKKPLAKET